LVLRPPPSSTPFPYTTLFRSNVETRLRRALDGELEAVILADAGLNRLGLIGHRTEALEPPRFLPAVGQGALGIECRAARNRGGSDRKSTRLNSSHDQISYAVF